MVSSPWNDLRSQNSGERGAVSTSDSRDDLRSQIEKLREELSRALERVERFRGLNESLSQEVRQVRAELVACKHNLQELNLLDGFLRSGAVRALNLENEPGLRELLTSFLSRALQTALDSGAVQFSDPRKTVE